MKKAIVSLLFFASSCVYAGSQEGQVTQILVRQSDDLHYFYMSGTAIDRAACAEGHSYWMIKDENSIAGRSQVSMILTAYASGQTLKVTGTGDCTRWGDGEDVNVVHLK